MKVSSLYRIPSILLLATTLYCNGTRIGSPKRDKNGRHHPERPLGSTSSKEKKEKSRFKWKSYNTWCVYDKNADVTTRLDDQFLASFLPLRVLNSSVIKKGIFKISLAFINPPWGHGQGLWDVRFWTEDEWMNCFINISGHSHSLFDKFSNKFAN